MDPLVLIDEFGADALRFTLAAMAAQGRDIKLAQSRRRGVSQFRDQALERLALRRDERVRGGLAISIRSSASQTFNKWIIGEAELCAKTWVTSAIEAYRFNEAALAQSSTNSYGGNSATGSRADQAAAFG